MNRTNRSIAALFILTALAVQPVATHAMVRRIAAELAEELISYFPHQAAQKGFNAAKQFASRHNLGSKAKTAAKAATLLSPVAAGYVIADPLHNGSKLDRETGIYTADRKTIVDRAEAFGVITLLTVAPILCLGSYGVMIPNAKCVSASLTILSNLKPIVAGGALVTAARLWAHYRHPYFRHRDRLDKAWLAENHQSIHPSKPGLWHSWHSWHMPFVANEATSNK